MIWVKYLSLIDNYLAAYIKDIVEESSIKYLNLHIFQRYTFPLHFVKWSWNRGTIFINSDFNLDKYELMHVYSRSHDIKIDMLW